MENGVKIKVHFYSYFKDLTACSDIVEDILPGETVGELVDRLSERFSKFGAMKKSALIAVGVEYQTRAYKLKEGDEVSFFPPVQGG